MDQAQYQRYLASREWAVRKEAVRKRARGRCERCRRWSMTSTRHLTYAHIGDEPLGDLQGLCDPCHAFQSGKRSIDPIGEGVCVYLAGKITNAHWREDLFVPVHTLGAWMRERAVCGQVTISPSETMNAGKSITWIDGGDLDGSYGQTNFLSFDAPWMGRTALMRGGFTFIGPWFVDVWGGHGNALDAGTHGQDAAGREHTLFRCGEAIKNCHVVFAWIDHLDAYRTLWELGYATALRPYRPKCIVVALSEKICHGDHTTTEANPLWLTAQAANWSFAAAKSCAGLGAVRPRVAQYAA